MKNRPHRRERQTLLNGTHPLRRFRYVLTVSVETGDRLDWTGLDVNVRNLYPNLKYVYVTYPKLYPILHPNPTTIARIHAHSLTVPGFYLNPNL
jgi:hypothetical protein